MKRTSIAEFFAATPERESVLAERTRWLNDDPFRYARLPPASVEPLDETIALLDVAVAATDPYERLLELGRKCEHDLIWLMPNADGAWCVVGGVVCFPSEWALGEKLGRPMVEVHAPVPALNEMLADRIDAFLAGFDARFGWQRFNWSLARDAELNHHPDRRLPKLDADASPEEAVVRGEHQLLVRLPHSGAVLFALGIELFAVDGLKSDSDAAARLARLLETMSPEIAAYKNLAPARERIVAYLRD